MYEDD
jgi:hypothetical protein